MDKIVNILALYLLNFKTRDVDLKPDLVCVLI